MEESVAKALFPLVLYALNACFLRDFLKLPIPKDVRESFDRLADSSLTLAGFAFTAITLLVTELGEAGDLAKPASKAALFYFGFSLASFMLAYMALRFRLTFRYAYFANGLADTGLWCAIGGLWRFFALYPEMSALGAVFGVLSICVFAYIAYNLLLYHQYGATMVRLHRG